MARKAHREHRKLIFYSVSEIISECIRAEKPNQGSTDPQSFNPPREHSPRFSDGCPADCGRKTSCCTVCLSETIRSFARRWAT